jgi:hypothetical protein
MDGQLVHEWKADREGGVAYLKPDGHLVRLGLSPRFNGPGAARDETAWNSTHWSFAGGTRVHEGRRVIQTPLSIFHYSGYKIY